MFETLSQERGERSAEIARNLRRLRQIYGYNLEDMRHMLGSDELAFLASFATPLLVNGELPENWIASAIEEAQKYRWEGLAGKLLGLSFPQRLALTDATERATKAGVTLEL